MTQRPTSPRLDRGSRPDRHAPTRKWAAGVVALFLGVTAVGLGPASAQAPGDPATAAAGPADDPFVQQLQIEQRRQQLATELEALQASNADVQAVLADLQRQVDEQTALVAVAQQALADATAEAERATRAEAAKAREVADLEERMRQMAINTYVSPPSDQKLSVLLSGGNINDFSTAMVYFDAKFGHDVDVAEQLERARVQLAARKRQAEQSVTQAAARSDEVAAALTELQAVQGTQAELAAVLEQRMGEIGTEHTALDAQGVHLEGAIAERRAELLALAGRQRSGGSVPLTRVDGFQVHESLAAPLAALLAAARADGIELGGGAYRSFEAQIATRRNNCGHDEHSIWHKPASQCSPPTARPGTSMHELGLAIDFTYQGSIISSRTSPAFVWLAEHAAGYGLHNLPSEPWHWSTTGG